jgi:hypothetical protein
MASTSTRAIHVTIVRSRSSSRLQTSRRTIIASADRYRTAAASRSYCSTIALRVRRGVFPE